VKGCTCMCECRAYSAIRSRSACAAGRLAKSMSPVAVLSMFWCVTTFGEHASRCCCAWVPSLVTEVTVHELLFSQSTASLPVMPMRQYDCPGAMS